MSLMVMSPWRSPCLQVGPRTPVTLESDGDEPMEEPVPSGWAKN